MKVNCVIDDDETDLLYGEVYDVISIERDWYRVIDRSGEDYMYSPKAFEIVDPLPTPPVLTEEDVRRGKGGMYVAVNEYAYNEYVELEVAEPMAVYGEAYPPPQKIIPKTLDSRTGVNYFIILINIINMGKASNVVSTGTHL